MSMTNAARVALLQDAGLETGPDGFDIDALVRFVEARRWRWTTTPATTYHGRPGKWRAMVYAPAPGGGRVGSNFVGGRGIGWTEAEALAHALVAPLSRERPVPAEDAA